MYRKQVPRSYTQRDLPIICLAFIIIVRVTHACYSWLNELLSEKLNRVVDYTEIYLRVIIKLKNNLKTIEVAEY